MPEGRQSVVLNVNDDETARYVVTRMLSRAGFKVEEAATGFEALARAEENPDLIVLDIRLPDIDGYEVCQRLKANPRTASIPILHTSATFVTSEKRVQGLEGGADGYLTQPFEAVELVATIRALLRARLAEDSTRAAAAEWQATFDGISDGVCLLDAEGLIRRHNRAFLSLLSLAACPSGADLSAIVDEGLRPALTGLLKASSQESVEVLALGGWLELKIDPLAGGRGRVLIASDISERKRLEEERRQRADALAEADHRKNEFLAMLAHELRNPLNAISVSLHIQSSVGAQDPQNIRLREAVKRQTRHLSRLVDDLLDVSRITRGKILLHKEPLDLRAVVERAIEACRLLIESRRHTLKFDLPREPLVVEGDAMRLEQVVVNLVNNAAKYTPPGGQIGLSLSAKADEEGASAVLDVEDNGMGIEPKMLEPIFELFTQEDQSLARSMGGLGIGLTLSRSLLHMHGGSITAESKGRGAGARFSVRIPLLAPSSESLPADTPRPPSLGSTRRVLIIEDNPDTLEMLQCILSMNGHHVEVASDGLAGLDLALTTRPDIALVDIGLPGLDGYQVAERLRDDRASQGIYLIAVTGYGRKEDRDRAYQAGFDAHLIKPIDPDKILSMLEEIPRSQRPSAPADGAPSSPPSSRRAPLP